MDSLQVDGHEHTNYLVHIYVTHANSVVQDWISKDKRTAVSRARIEKDIIRLIHQNEGLSLPFKIACTSMILHTNMFDSFWYGCKLSAGLSSRSIKRMTPNYDLVDEVPCPSSATTTNSSSPLPTPSTSSNGDSGSVAGDEAPAGKKATTTRKKNGATKRQPPKRKTPAKPRAKRAQPKTKAAGGGGGGAAVPLLKDVAKPTGVVKTITPPKETTTLSPLRRTNRPIGPTGREVYEMVMARETEPYTWGGPSSGTDSSPDDDESDSDEETTGVNPIKK